MRIKDDMMVLGPNSADNGVRGWLKGWAPLSHLRVCRPVVKRPRHTTSQVGGRAAELKGRGWSQSTRKRRRKAAGRALFKNSPGLPFHGAARRRAVGGGFGGSPQVAP